MRPALLLVPAAFLLACSGTPPSAASPGASATAAGSTAPDDGGAMPASMSGSRPVVPVEEVGTVTVHAGKDGCSVEVRKADGTMKPTTACDSVRKAREAARLSACSIGGDVLWPKDKAAAEEGSHIELQVGRYTQTDAKADLELICAPFANLKNPATGKSFDPSGLDPSQRAALRAALLAETMTPRRWRLSGCTASARTARSRSRRCGPRRGRKTSPARASGRLRRRQGAVPTGRRSGARRARLCSARRSPRSVGWGAPIYGLGVGPAARCPSIPPRSASRRG